jgi:FkbM family methyltransferase
MSLAKRVKRVRAALLPTKQDRWERDQRKTVKTWKRAKGDQTLRQNYTLDSNSVVIDLGGYEGQWASDIFARSCCRVFVFEPVRAFADKIKARFRANPKIEVFACGLGGNTRTETIHLGADGSSVFAKGGAVEKIEIVDAAEWFRARDLPDIALMKMNIEGGEYELLDRLIETGLIGRIGDIQIQFHNIAADSAARMEAIQADLAKTHELTYQYRFVWENWRRKA